ncbi:MAG: outer-membrane lipoprotein carrier protein LolA, partial [Gammaproteobacteria bacterium]
QLLNGETGQLAEDYEVTTVRSDNDPQLSFYLTPRSSDSVYDRISINFMGIELDSIHLDNKNGEQTLWQFNNLMRNIELADSLFAFEPPAGIEVVENNYVERE